MRHCRSAGVDGNGDDGGEQASKDQREAQPRGPFPRQSCRRPHAADRNRQHRDRLAKFDLGQALQCPSAGLDIGRQQQRRSDDRDQQRQATRRIAAVADRKEAADRLHRIKNEARRHQNDEQRHSCDQPERQCQPVIAEGRDVAGETDDRNGADGFACEHQRRAYSLPRRVAAGAPCVENGKQRETDQRALRPHPEAERKAADMEEIESERRQRQRHCQDQPQREAHKREAARRPAGTRYIPLAHLLSLPRNASSLAHRGALLAAEGVPIKACWQTISRRASTRRKFWSRFAVLRLSLAETANRRFSIECWKMIELREPKFKRGDAVSASPQSFRP